MAMHWLDPALQPLAATLDRVLALDPASSARLQRLDGRSMAIVLGGLELTIHMLFEGGHITLTAAPPSDSHVPDATISGTPAALFALAQDPERGGKDVNFSGDLGLVRDISHLVSKADLDWEEQLARVLGDVPAHHLGNLARDLLRWLRSSRESAESGLAEYLTEESRALPTVTEVELFLSGVDRLRQDADRLQARMERLQRKLDASGSSRAKPRKPE